MKSVKRLYKELKPEHYTLSLHPDINALKFEGQVTIRLRKTGRPSQRLTFHQRGLKITSADIMVYDKKGSGRNIAVARINNQDSLDEVRLHTQEMIYSGSYSVTLHFSGTITRNMTGLYPCYFTVDGIQHVMLATQFESNYARQLFPCIDEPEAKATFDLTLSTQKDLTVLANTPIKEQKPATSDSLLAISGGQKLPATNYQLLTTTFETTPKMSTYLLAFVIGEMQSQRTKTKRGTEVAVWSTIAQPLDALDFALKIAKESVEFFEDYFGIPYPLAKLDHVGLPDFTSGAMENWGLITYRERLLVAYKGDTSQAVLEHIATVITHETSHQWFGNLVTMKWWDDLWLNESFANMMEYQAVDALYPEWHIWESFVMNEGLRALRRDATTGVQAVRTGVRHPDEIDTLFDGSIVYAKGGRLLYMLKMYIGDEAFRKGLTAYFKKHAYGNTSGDDLWQALSEASGIDVGEFMNPWLERAGFPVVSVTAAVGSITLEQRHFLDSGAVDDGLLWPTPLFANQAELPKRLDTAKLTVKTSTPSEMLIDQGAPGHYIVNYASPEHRAHVTELIKKQTLPVPDRLMLLNGASMLAKAQVQSFGEVLELLKAYEHEQAEPVWAIMALIIGEAQRFIDLDETLEEKIKAFIRGLIASEYQRLGWEERPNESVADNKLRPLIIGFGCYADEPEIVAEALRRLKAAKNLTTLPASLRGLIYSVAVRDRVPGAVDALLKLHDETVNSDLKADVMDGLTATHDPELAKQLLGRLTDAALVKPQDADFWFFFLLRNRYTRDVSWQWMVDNWPWIEKTYGNDKSYDDFPRIAAGICNTKAWAEKYEAFYGPKRDQLALERNITIGLNEIATRVAWLERDLPSVQKFFSK